MVRTTLAATLERRRGDLIGLSILGVVIAAIVSRILSGERLIGQDATVYYLPMFHYLGERLSSGEIPAWNPFQYGGSPFAADPESGWMYYPSMVLFSVASLSVASTAFLILHYVLAAYGTYALARVVEINPVGATVAGIGIVSTVWYYRMSISAPAYVQFTAWLPIALLFLELALRQTWSIRRFALIGLSGLAFGQILGSWLGKGSVYAALAIGLYLAYRTLWRPSANHQRPRTRLLELLGVGSIFSIWSLGLQAAGVLPRVEYHGVSNLAEGYQDSVANTAGWPLADLPGKLVGTGNESPGNVLLILSVVGLFVSARTMIVPYCGMLLLFIGTLMIRESNLIADTVDWIPLIGSIHSHFPQHIMMLAYLPIALLAGSAVSAISQIQTFSRGALIAPIIPLLIILVSGVDVAAMTTLQRMTAAGILVGIGLILWFPGSHLRTYAVVAAIVGLHVGTFLSQTDEIERFQSGPVMRSDLDDHYGSSGAVDFIAARQSETSGTERYFGYDPVIGQQITGFFVPYRREFYLPQTIAIEVNNRATIFGLHDIQGQNNPIQIELYQDLIDRLNGFPQDYHEATVFREGLTSPFLDLLSVRYIIIPSAIPADREDLMTLQRRYPVVFKDAEVQVLERPSAFPRAWILHDTTVVSSSDAAFASVAAQESDELPRSAPVIDGPLLEDSGMSTALDSVAITREDPESVSYQVNLESVGLLVRSDVVYPGWNVYVDGNKQELVTAYGAFQAVELAPGSHTVEFRFESKSLRVGILVSIASHLALSGLGIAVGIQSRKNTSSL